MPWKLVPPRKGKSPYYYVRGKYLGIALDKSTGTGEKAAARTILKTWRKQAERGEFARPEPAEQKKLLTFGDAAEAYMQAGGASHAAFLIPILVKWESRALDSIDQIAIDTLAAELYPDAPSSTRNRQVHTPVSAVLKRAGRTQPVKRPLGWRGKRSISWLKKEQAFALLQAADRIEPEFGLFCRFLLYTGMRLGEALSLKLQSLSLAENYVYLPDSKNGQPRGCHVPPYLVQAFLDQPPREQKPIERDEHGHYVNGGVPVEDAGVPFLQRKQSAKLFRYHAGGALRDKLAQAMADAGLTFPRRQKGFHLFCHTWGAWMRRYGLLDTSGLVGTNRWRSRESASIYEHVEASDAAKRADLLPTPERGDDVRKEQRRG